MSKRESSFQNNSVASNKIPFNKKKWREQKYSNKAKIQKWEIIKRKQAERQYYKECKKLDINLNLKHDSNKESKSHKSFREPQSQYKALLQKNKEEKQKQERIKKEKNEAIKAYKEKKQAKYKKLSMKTRKGQPLMKGRIELLLEKIQKHYVTNSSKIKF